MDSHGPIGFDGERRLDQTSIKKVKLSRRIRWVLAKAAMREELELVWGARSLSPRGWGARIRGAHKLKRDVQASLDQMFLYGDGDDA